MKRNLNKNIFSIATLSMLIVTLAACSTTSIPNKANYTQAVTSWQGASAEDLVSVWGVPDKREKAATLGNTLYIYQKEEVKTVPGYTQPGQIVPAGMGAAAQGEYYAGYSTNMNTYAKVCKTIFEVNREGEIVSTSTKGNACRANDSKVRYLINPEAVNTRTVPTLEESK